MIWESAPWKLDLLRRADRLAKRASQRRWTEASFATVEQDCMLAAYAIRKLAEATKVSEEILDAQVPVQQFAARKGSITRMNWHKLESHFDLGKSQKQSISPKDLCNQLIHSFVFAPEVDEKGLTAFLVASDRQRSKALLRVRLSDFLVLLRSVGNDDPTHFAGSWDESLGDYRVTIRTPHPSGKAP